MDDKLLKLLEPLDENEQALMKLDSIFKALDVNTIQDIETLATYFIASNNQDLNSEYKQNVEKINNKLQSLEGGGSSIQNSTKHGSKNRARSHTVSQSTSRRTSNVDGNSLNDTDKKYNKNRFRSHTITQGGLSNISENNLGGNISNNDLLGTNSINKYGLDKNPSFSSNYNDDRLRKASIHDSHNTVNSKTSSNASINNQKEGEDFGLIDSSDTMIVIKRFLHDQKRNKLIDQISATSENELLDDDDFEKKLESIDKKKKNNQNNKLSNKAYEQIQKDYWERMTNIIDDKRYRLWKV